MRLSHPVITFSMSDVHSLRHIGVDAIGIRVDVIGLRVDDIGIRVDDIGSHTRLSPSACPTSTPSAELIVNSRTVFIFNASFTASSKKLGGELRNSSVVERLIKGLTAVGGPYLPARVGAGAHAANNWGEN